MKISYKGKNGYTLYWHKGVWQDRFTEVLVNPDGDLQHICHGVNREGVAYGMKLAKEHGMMPIIQIA